MEARCRLCFEERTEMERIFPDNDDEDDIDYESQMAIKIFKCTSLQLPVDDEDLTSQVCKDCTTKLDEFFQFRVRCKKNNVLYCKRNQQQFTQHTKTEPEISIGPESDEISLDKLDETLLRALEGKDVDMDPSAFDDTFGSEVKPEDLLKISMSYEAEQQLASEEAVSSSSARCAACGSEYSSSFELSQHMEYCPARMKPNPFHFQMSNVTSLATSSAELNCFVCQKSFNNIQDLKYHESLHSNASLKCNFCLQTFTCQRTLKQHMDQHKMKNTLPDGRFKCDLCDSTFKLYGNMIIHRRSHTGERPYACNICGRAFSTSSNMKTHMNVVHSQDRPYKCHLCHKSFNSETRLRSHVESHSYPMGSMSNEASGSELSSTCKICNKTFSHPSYLTIHYRVHTGERPYQCKFCTSAFATSGNLKVHMRIHATQKVRPYKCNMCTKSFLHASNLSVHKKTQHY